MIQLYIFKTFNWSFKFQISLSLQSTYPYLAPITPNTSHGSITNDPPFIVGLLHPYGVKNTRSKSNFSFGFGKVRACPLFVDASISLCNLSNDIMAWYLYRNLQYLPFKMITSKSFVMSKKALVVLNFDFLSSKEFLER